MLQRKHTIYLNTDEKLLLKDLLRDARRQTNKELNNKVLSADRKEDLEYDFHLASSILIKLNS